MGNSPFASPTIPGRRIPPAESLDLAAPQASSSSLRAHQQHADLSRRMTSKKLWAHALEAHVRDVPEQREYRIQGEGRVPLLFEALDGSGDTAVIDLRVGNVVLHNRGTRATVAGGLSYLVDRVVQYAGSFFERRF